MEDKTGQDKEWFNNNLGRHPWDCSHLCPGLYSLNSNLSPWSYFQTLIKVWLISTGAAFLLDFWCSWKGHQNNLIQSIFSPSQSKASPTFKIIFIHGKHFEISIFLIKTIVGHSCNTGIWTRVHQWLLPFLSPSLGIERNWTPAYTISRAITIA